ncbi:MAG TPA: hypothetical protein VF008_08860 [Niastella sp.]
MNFDNLKDAWANDKTEDPHLPFTNVPVGKTSSAISKIRQNMKREFNLQIIGFILLTLPLLGSSKNALSVFIVSIAIFVLLIQTVYYYYRFYLFYKATGRYDLSIKKSIYKIIYELELNIEIYKTFNYCAMPLIILIIIGDSTNLTTFFQQKVADGSILNHTFLLFIFLVLVGSQIIISFFLNLHIRLRYGRHLAELKRIMEDLETEE